jgi:aminoglycoside 2'-N-acetyltransferase I
MQIIFRDIHNMPKSEKDQLNTLSNRAFGEEKLEFVEGIELKWGGNIYSFIGLFEGKMVSTIGIIPRKIRLGSRTVKVAGIGGVATDPEFQNRGFAGLLLEKTNRWLDQRPAPEIGIFDIAMLFCETKRIQYYGKFGYFLIGQPVFIHLQGRRLRFRENCMVRLLHGFEWNSSTVDLRGRPW